MIKVTKDPKDKIVIANNSVQNCCRESQQKLKSCLFSSLHNSKYDYGGKTDSFKDR